MTDQPGTSPPAATEPLATASARQDLTTPLAVAAGLLAVASGVVVLILGFGAVPLTRWTSLLTLGRYILGALLVLSGAGCLLPAARHYALGFILGAGLSLGVVAWFNGYPGRTVIPGIVLVVGALAAGATLFMERRPTLELSPFVAIGLAAFVLLAVGLFLTEIRFSVHHEVRDTLKPLSEKPAASILLALSVLLATTAAAAVELRAAGAVFLGIAAAHFWSFTPIVALLKYAHYHPALGFWFLFALPVVLTILGGVMTVMAATRAQMDGGPGVVTAPTPPAP